MRLSITTVGRGGEQHVVLSAMPDTTVAQAAAWIAAAAGESRVDHVYVGDRLLVPGAKLSEAGLRDGAIVGLGAPVTGPPDPYAAALMEVHAVSGSGSGLIFPLGLGSYRVGAGERCAIRVPFGPEHAATVLVRPDGTVQVILVRDAQLLRVADPQREPGAELSVASSASGSVNEDGAVDWPADADLALGDTVLRWALPGPPDGRVVPADDGATLVVDRPPRAHEPIPELRFRMPTQPQRPQRGTATVSAIGGRLAARDVERKSYRQSLAEYRAARAALTEEVAGVIRAERLLRLRACPDPATVLLTATGPGRRLWERRRTDADHLALRVGTVTQPSITGVELPDPAGRRTLHWPVPFVPVTVSLPEHGVLGLAGPTERIRPLAAWLVAQIAVEHAPSDVRMVLLLGLPDAEPAWDWVRWLPHLRSSLGSPPAMIGNEPETIAQRVAELCALVTRRQQAYGPEATPRPRASDEPDVVLVVDGAWYVREVPGLAWILAAGPAVGVYTICIEHGGTLLPPEATAVLADGRGGMTLRRRERPEAPGILADLVAPAWCDAVARGLAALRDRVPQEEEETTPSEHVPLLDLLALPDPEPAAIAARWAPSNAMSASTVIPIGTGPEGALTIDLVRDGPHALIAGTSASATSEFLRTLLASLAAANRPDELTFFLIGHKDAAEFRECVELPHTVALATDLDDPQIGSQILSSLGAELRRRERLLNEHDLDDLAGYLAARRQNPEMPPLARLVIAVDEFAALSRAIPEFVPGLLSVARRGRLVGIHVVLATRQPSGAITSEIRADVDLRIALRTASPAESREVVETEDAASLAPGRALLARLGSPLTPFQTAHSGAAYGEYQRAGDWAVPVPWFMLGRPLLGPTLGHTVENRIGTDLAVLVEALRKAAAHLAIEPQPRPWPPALPERITVAALPPTSPGRPGDLPPVPYGLSSPLGRQTRLAVALDVDTFGHLYIVGETGSGKTEALRTLAGSIAMRLPCADVHLYGIDAGGGALTAVTALPHTGGVALLADVPRVDRLVTRLSQELTRRQELVSSHFFANLAELRAGTAPETRPSHLLVLIDDWTALASIANEYDGGRLMDELIKLLREGPAAGMHLIVTGDAALLGGRIGSLNDNRLLLRLTEPPAAYPPGRGHRADEKSEMQVALLSGDPSARAQAETLRRIGAYTAKRDAALGAGARPFSVL